MKYFINIFNEMLCDYWKKYIVVDKFFVKINRSLEKGIYIFNDCIHMWSEQLTGSDLIIILVAIYRECIFRIVDISN